MKRRRARRLAAVIGGSLLVAACSSDDAPAAEPAATTAVASTVPTVSSVPSVESPGSTVPSVEPVSSEPDSGSNSGSGTGVQPEGFTTTMVEITKADGTVCEVCMWLADDGAERARGLMGVTDLGDASGMAFVFDRPTTGAFYMFQTVTPLSIAWFAPDGTLVSTADMEPCVFADSGACERFPAGGQFDLAIEVFQGDLASIGIEAGSTARVLADTEAAACPVGS